jgi:hypothetical protein
MNIKETCHKDSIIVATYIIYQWDVLSLDYSDIIF